MDSSLPNPDKENKDQLYNEVFDQYISEIPNPNTKETYSRHINQFFQWCFEKGYKIDRLNEDIFLEYIRHRGGVSPSVEQQLAALRNFFNYFISKTSLLRNPVPQITKPRSREPLREVNKDLQTQILQLLQAFPDIEIVDLRDRALLSILVFTNLRVTEIKDLRVRDYIKTSEGAQLIYTKRLTFDDPYELSTQLSKYIDAYLIEAKINDQNDLPLFRRINKNGQLSEKRLSRGGINTIVSQRILESL